MPVIPYCSDPDVRAISPGYRDDEVEGPEMDTMIAAGVAYINKGLATMYDVPFSDVVVHPLGIPEEIRWLCAEKVKCLLHKKLYEEAEPNETDAGRNCDQSVEDQLQRLRDCDEGLSYPDGTAVPRIGDCPDSAPGPGTSYVSVKSNTQNDPYVFDLLDVRDLDDYDSFAWD